MRLFVGNATRQNYTFIYTAPENSKSLERNIPRGCQQQIPGDFTTEDIDHIISPHLRYGMIQDGAIDQTRAFHGLCYSIGKPITGARLTYLMNRNVDDLVMRGAQTRKAAAVAQNMEFQRNLVENDRPEQITNFEVTFQEDRLPGDPNPLPQISEGLRLSQNRQSGPPPTPARSPGRAARRKAA